ncbi:pyridoxal-phosphate dependent enzyme domain-containing protein [Ditylenchus destructor]|nr:pyridoxal-phosphate dependent enzyme domain-containing protein [Ditylenchus destructor]
MRARASSDTEDPLMSKTISSPIPFITGPLEGYAQPDAQGRFGPVATPSAHGYYGGRFVAETLIHALDELNEAYARYSQDPEFIREFQYELAHFVGRPSPIYHARRLSEELGGAQIWFKREDLNHTGAHKVNNCIGQALLAKRMGKPRVIAETGAGQHGVASATVAARYGMECVVYMGAEDVKRQSPNVYRMTCWAPRSCRWSRAPRR